MAREDEIFNVFQGVNNPGALAAWLNGQATSFNSVGRGGLEANIPAAGRTPAERMVIMGMAEAHRLGSLSRDAASQVTDSLAANRPVDMKSAIGIAANVYNASRELTAASHSFFSNPNLDYEDAVASGERTARRYFNEPRGR